MEHPARALHAGPDVSRPMRATTTIHSHHLRPGHPVLVRVVVWIPVTKSVHVVVWVHLGAFGDLPQLGEAGGAGGDGAGAVEMFSL